MSETDAAGSAPAADDDETRRSIREGLEQLRIEAARLASAEAELAAAQHGPLLRRRAVDVGGALAIGLVLLTAFGLANAAAVAALSTALSPWASALVLAAAWIVVAAALALVLWLRAERGEGWPWWRVLAAAGGDRERLERERDDARQAVRGCFDRLAPDLAKEAASAAVPLASSIAAGMASGMASGVAGGVVDAGGDLIEGSDEFVESITVEMPGGGLVNQVWDVVLMPGRWGVRVVTTALKRPES